MGWHALDNKKQVKNNKPAKAFSMARKVYGDRMEEAPKSHVKAKMVTTNFDELLNIRKANASRRDRSNRRFLMFLGMAMALFIVIFILTTIDRLSAF